MTSPSQKGETGPRICACGNMIKLKSKVDKCTACVEGRSRFIREQESEADAHIDYIIFGRR